MKRLILSLTFFCLLICSCTPTATVPPVAQTPIDTATQTLTPSPSTTPSPTLTPTQTITPLPTIPTFIPTFDVRTIVTATPAPKAECPKEKSQMPLDFKTNRDSYKQILDFLNNGVAKQAIIKAYRQEHNWANESIIQEKDVTADGNSELLFAGDGFLIAYVCNSNQYQAMFLLGETYHNTTPAIISILDMNLDGVDEIITIEGDDRIRSVSVFEWNGGNFQKLNGNDQSCSEVYGPSWAEAQDTDGNETLELILKQAIPIWAEYSMGLPWRKEYRTCAWNGKQFVFTKVERPSPEYRFQAIQDADQTTLPNKYEQALNLYQQAIYNDKLGWWSVDRRIYEIAFATGSSSNDLTSPKPDLTEYPRLAAYAYYRMVILHTYLSQMDAAQTQFNTLQEKFGNDPYGKPYADMASAFWNTHQSTHKMYDGCAVAIEYAAEHPDILIPLGSDYHGAQSHIYVPADVCPFR